MNLQGTQFSPRQTPRWKLRVGVQSSETGGSLTAGEGQGHLPDAPRAVSVAAGTPPSELTRHWGRAELAVWGQGCRIKRDTAWVQLPTGATDDVSREGYLVGPSEAWGQEGGPS